MEPTVTLGEGISMNKGEVTFWCSDCIKKNQLIVELSQEVSDLKKEVDALTKQIVDQGVVEISCVYCDWKESVTYEVDYKTIFAAHRKACPGHPLTKIQKILDEN